MYLFVLAFMSFLVHLDAGYINDRGLGTDCLYDEDCLTRNSFCKGNKICACKIGYQYDAGSDICFPREVNLKCNEDYDCSALPNVRCTNGFCKCKNDYVPSNDKSGCLPSMKLTTLCEEDSQCSSVMNRSFCDYVTRQCTCDRGLRRDPYRMLCIEKSSLHSSCLFTDECEWSAESKGRVECKPSGHFISTCECKEGFVEVNEVCYSGASTTFILMNLLVVSPIFSATWFG